MDRFNPNTSNDTPKTVEEQTPHSGVHYDEKPVKDFDNTKLAEAVDQGLITVPEDVSPLIETNPSDVPPIVPPTYTTEQGNPKPERKKLGLGAKIGAGLAGLALAGGAAFGITSAVNAGNNTPPEKDPDETSQVDEGNEKPPVEEEKTFEQLVEETKIEAGLSAEEYAEALQSRLNDWALAGATGDEAYESWFEAGGTVDYEDKLAASQTAIYTNALFGPGYQNEPSLVNAEANFTSRNAVWLGRWMRSYDYENNKGTLEIGTVIEQAEVVSENPETGERVVYIAGYDTNNAEDAKFVNEETRQKVVDANGESWDHTLTLKTVDGVEYITKWED